jgi:hypothetical protein
MGVNNTVDSVLERQRRICREKTQWRQYKKSTLIIFDFSPIISSLVSLPSTFHFSFIHVLLPSTIIFSFHFVLFRFVPRRFPPPLPRLSLALSQHRLVTDCSTNALQMLFLRYGSQPNAFAALLHASWQTENGQQLELPAGVQNWTAKD